MTVDIINLAKRYGEHFRLYVPTLHIGAQERVGLVGNNGAGKTTLLRLLLDLLQADDGTVQLDNESVHASFAWKEKTGSYLDESFLIDFLTAEEFFYFVGNVYGLDHDATHVALDPYRSFLAPELFSSSPPFIGDLSLGNKKKVGIVAAMFIKPRLLVLDEPFANLDPGSQIRLKSMLKSLCHEHQTTLFLSSHDLAHVTDVCDRIVVLHDGEVANDIVTSDMTLQELEAFFSPEA